MSRTPLSATGDSLRYLLPLDTLVLDVHAMGQLVFRHCLEPKQTLFSLAQHYGLTVEEIYAYNPEISRSYKIGDEIMIPLPARALVKGAAPNTPRWKVAPAFYRVRRGDTMFGICHRLFNMSEGDLLAQNPAMSTTLKVGQTLFIGWVSTEGVPENWHEVRGGPFARMNYALKLEYFRASAGKRIVEERGGAAWPRTLDRNDGFFALHRTAPINSIVEVHNPMSRQTIYLRVIGRLPDQLYDHHTVVVVSPLGVKALGGLDNKFYVRLKHY